MCNCIPSAPTYSIFRTQKLITTTTFSPHKLAILKNDGFDLIIQNNKSNRKPPCLKVSKPESYEINNELRLKEIESRFKDKEADSSDFIVNEEIGAIDESVPLESFDFLELKSDLIEENLENEKVDQVERSNKGGESMRLEEEEEFGKIVGRKELRGGRQVVRRSSVLAKQVISMQSALSLGFVSQLWVDTISWAVLVVEVRPTMLSGEMERFLLEDVCQVGDVVLVEDESVLEEDIKMLGLDTLVGYNVVTPSRRSIGKVRGFTFNINSGAVELLELDSFGISIIPSSLVSTYALFVEDVIDVESDTVVVHETAASNVQRLSKGFWDTPNMEAFKNQLDDYPDLERRRRQSSSRRNRQKFTSTMRESEDDLELPMDYL